MQYALKNLSVSDVSLLGSLKVPSVSSLSIYNSVTHEVSSDVSKIIASMTYHSDDYTNNLNYCLHNGLIKFTVDGEVQDNSVFYDWFAKFKINYQYYCQFLCEGIGKVSLDNENNKIILGTRSILVSDLPDNIDAKKIASGLVSNEEFNTLNNIRTDVTIQQQLDSKLDANSKRVYVHIQSSASALWVITHNLNSEVVPVVYDATGEEVIASIIPLDANNLAVRFRVASTGKCVISY